MHESARGHLRWPLDVTTELVDGVLVVVVTGRLSARSAPRLAAALDEAAARSSPVVVDLAGVDYISSAGIEMFDRLAAAYRGRLTVVGVTEPVRVAFALAGQR